MTRERGLTLLEVVLAVSLLTSLFAVSSVWIVGVARTEHDATGALRFEAAAQALFHRIEEALTTGDTAVSGRVKVQANELAIWTRESGTPGTWHLRFEPAKERLRGRFEPLTGTPPPEETALGCVRAFAATLDSKGSILRVEIESLDGKRIARRVPVP
jgi:type II secretory pathway pseudopilin PulG